MFFIVEGTGILRFGEQVYPLRKGDVICAPPGGHDTSHQIINNSESELKYLGISTMEEPDVMEYPDSGKFGVFAGAAPGGSKDKRTFSVFAKKTDAIDYWDGEDK